MKKSKKSRSFTKKAKKRSSVLKRRSAATSQKITGFPKREKRALNISVPNEIIHRTKVRVISIGGGGGSILSEICSYIKRADFVAANTDSRALKDLSNTVKKFQFGQNVTRGLGTGMNPALAELAALNDKEKIKKIFEGQDLCIIIACLGGGTSSGASPVFAKIARDEKAFTYGIFTLPFAFEGEKKMALAQEALKKIKPYLNTYSVIPNERIFQIIEKNSPLKFALSAINKRLAGNLRGLLEMIYLPGLINIDFADLRTILEGRGRLTYLSTIEVDDPNKEEGIKKIVSSELYPYNTKGTRGILYDITGGKDLQLADVSRIAKIISESVSKDAKIIFGISQAANYGNKIKITLLATGCSMKPSVDPTPILSMVRPAPKAGREEPRAPIQKMEHKILPKPEVKTKVLSRRKKTRKANSTGKTNKKGNKKQGNTSAPLTKDEKNPQQAIFKLPEGNTTQIKESETKIRRTALELKKVVEAEEQKILEEEKMWDNPAIFRKKQISSN